MRRDTDAEGSTMLEAIFPRAIDNDFRGHAAALWLFGVYVALRIVMNANVILNTRSVAVGADGFPLDTMTPNAAATVLTVMAVQAVGQLVLALLGLVVLIRYRAMVPLITVLLLGELIARRICVLTNSIERAEAISVGTYLNYGFLALLLSILALSLVRRTLRGAARTNVASPAAWSSAKPELQNEARSNASKSPRTQLRSNREGHT